MLRAMHTCQDGSGGPQGKDGRSTSIEGGKLWLSRLLAHRRCVTHRRHLPGIADSWKWMNKFGEMLHVFQAWEVGELDGANGGFLSSDNSHLAVAHGRVCCRNELYCCLWTSEILTALDFHTIACSVLILPAHLFLQCS